MHTFGTNGESNFALLIHIWRVASGAVLIGN